MLATMGMLKFEKPYHRSVVARREAEKLFLYLPLNDYICFGFFFSEITTHRGLATDELVFDPIDGELHHLPPSRRHSLLSLRSQHRQSPETAPGSCTGGPWVPATQRASSQRRPRAVPARLQVTL